jgi:hypothetical protein
MKKNPRDPKILSIQKKKKNQYNDVQNQMKKTKRKRKSSSPTLRGTIDHFWKDNLKKQKVRKQA